MEIVVGEELRQIITSSTFSVYDCSWIYAKVAGDPKLDDCFMVSRDKDETTAVFEASKQDRFEIMEQNKDLRKLIEIKVKTMFW